MNKIEIGKGYINIGVEFEEFKVTEMLNRNGLIIFDSVGIEHRKIDRNDQYTFDIRYL